MWISTAARNATIFDKVRSAAPFPSLLPARRLQMPRGEAAWGGRQVQLLGLGLQRCFEGKSSVGCRSCEQETGVCASSECDSSPRRRQFSCLRLFVSAVAPLNRRDLLTASSWPRSNQSRSKFYFSFLMSIFSDEKKPWGFWSACSSRITDRHAPLPSLFSRLLMKSPPSQGIGVGCFRSFLGALHCGVSPALTCHFFSLF